jgi:AraC-like DNA-binding protein
VRNPEHRLVKAFGVAGFDLLADTLPERVDHALVADILARAPEALGEECIGLRLAEEVEPTDLDILHYIARSSPTLPAAAEKLAAHIAILHDGLQLDLQAYDNGTVGIKFELPRDLLVPLAMAELVLGFALRLSRYLTGIEVSPAQVWFRNHAPRDKEPYRRFFGAPCLFDQESYCIAVHPLVMSLPIPSADPALCELLEMHARQMTASLRTDSGFCDQVRQIIVKQLSGGNPDISFVAKHLHMSPRTLRRRLEQEGATYQELLNELRVTLAKRYLDDRISVEDAAFLLGYSSSHAFRRAFKRYTGLAPLAYRERAAVPPLR